MNNSWYLVDLPGYGYAKRSKALRAEWSGFTQQYFLRRETLANVLLLVDASVPVQALDMEVANWLGNAQARHLLPVGLFMSYVGLCADPGNAQVPFSLVFTKMDKRKKGVPAPQENMATFQVRLLMLIAFVADQPCACSLLQLLQLLQLLGHVCRSSC